MYGRIINTTSILPCKLSARKIKLTKMSEQKSGFILNYLNMLKKVVTTIPALNTSVSSGYTVPQGKVFILTGVMARSRNQGTHMNDSSYE